MTPAPAQDPSGAHDLPGAPGGAPRVRAASVALALAVAACDGPQSALDPAGTEAARVADLFWVMAAGAGAIWLAVIGLAVWAVRAAPRGSGRGATLLLCAGAGVPTVVLAALLSYGLGLMPDFRAPGAGLRIAVTGEQFWWRVRYHAEGRDAPVTSANEVRLPAGRRTELTLDSPDVIHSFWIPPLAGKVDMIPGRTNRLVLEPTRPGVYRGACAEFCGSSHALMAFSVVVMEATAFDAWLAREAGDAVPATDDPVAPERRGASLFLAHGCGACHAIRGTRADGVIGPDLTHVGSRKTIGAGILDNAAPEIARFVALTETIKPGAKMPSFGMLPEGDLSAIASYLGSLK